NARSCGGSTPSTRIDRTMSRNSRSVMGGSLEPAQGLEPESGVPAPLHGGLRRRDSTPALAGGEHVIDSFDPPRLHSDPGLGIRPGVVRNGHGDVVVLAGRPRGCAGPGEVIAVP